MARYLFASQNRKTETEKGKEGLPSKWPNSFPAGPAHLSPCRLLQAGAQLRGDHAVAADEPPGHLLLPLAFSSRLEASHRHADPFPPLLIVFLPLLRPISSKSESSSERAAVADVATVLLSH